MKLFQPWTYTNSCSKHTDDIYRPPPFATKSYFFSFVPSFEYDVTRQARLRKSKNSMQIPRTHRPALDVGDAVKHLEALGVATEGIRGRAATRKRGRSLTRDGEDVMDMDVEEGGKKVCLHANLSI